MKKVIAFILLIVVICFAITCRKKNGDDDCPACPSVESISPVSAKCYEKLTIFGRNFDIKPSANIVKINGVQINPDSILSGTSSQLVVKVPRGCGSGPVTVDIDDELSNFGAPPSFTYIPRILITDYGSHIGFPPKPNDCITGNPINSGGYSHPLGIVVDASNNVFFSDDYQHCIYKLDGANNRDSCFFAGNYGSNGHFDGLGTLASFNSPRHMYIDNNNTIYLAENNYIRTISPSGNVSTYTTDTSLTQCTGIAFQPGNANVGYVSVADQHIICKLTRQGTKVITTIFAGAKGKRGYVDGAATIARFRYPQDLVVDNQGNVFVSDSNHVIRKITPTGIVSTLAGNGIAQYADGHGAQASFNLPLGLCIDGDNNIFVADQNNNCIRQITPNGDVSTFYQFTASMITPKPFGVAKDRNGNFYITFQKNDGNGVKKISIF